MIFQRDIQNILKEFKQVLPHAWEGIPSLENNGIRVVNVSSDLIECVLTKLEEMLGKRVSQVVGGGCCRSFGGGAKKLFSLF